MFTLTHRKRKGDKTSPPAAAATSKVTPDHSEDITFRGNRPPSPPPPPKRGVGKRSNHDGSYRVL